MQFSDIRLAEMLSTRLCHDLTGPIGALANGAEFLADEGFSMQDEAVQLISQSAEQAVNRLQYYRAAYGRITSSGEASLSEVKEQVAQYLSGGKVSLDWPDNFTDALTISVSRKFARLLMNMVIVACASMIRGGILSIRIQQEGEKKILVATGSGLSIKWETEQQQILQGLLEVDSIQPSTVQLYYMTKLAQELNAEMTVNADAETFEMLAIKSDDF